MTVNQVNDAGTFGGATSFSTNEDTPFTGVITFSDVADGYTTDNMAVATGGDPVSGTLVLAVDGTFTYTPDGNFNGSDSFTVEVTDEDGNTESQVISVTVTADNDPTVFGGDTSGTGAEDAAAITGDLDATDADGLTDPIFTIQLGDGANNGTATINSASGAWSYTPAANFNGSDSFTVSVTDDAGN
ncbi:outer membrane adhesin like protein, partial [Rhodopirellula baltica SWK14]